MDQAKFDVSKRDKAEIYIAKFANGRLNAEKADGCKFACFESTEQKKKRILVCETDDMRYEGSNTDMTTSSSSYCKQMLAAYNKRTGKVHLYNTEMFHMKPVFTDKEKEKVEDETDLTLQQMTDNLTSAFGTAKKRRAMESRIRNKIGTESLTAAMTNAVEDVLCRPDSKQIAVKPPETDMATGIPPYDKDAQNPADAYKLQGIIPDEVRTALEGPAQEFVSSDKATLSTWSTQKTYPSFILNQLCVLPLESKSRLRKAICLKYLQYMMQLFNMKPTKLREKQPFGPNVPQIAQKLLLDSFTISALAPGGKTVRCMPARMKDKLLNYIAVLCLILENFNLECSALLVDLKIGQKRMITAFRALGCRTKLEEKKELVPGIKAFSMITVTLPVPLTFPERTVRNKKQRR